MLELKKPKNIVLLTIDCLRKDRLAYSGKLHNVTPFLDSIAKKSVVFHNCYTTSSSTSPSMVSYLTSKYPFENGNRFTGDKLNLDNNTSFIELLREHYHTVGFSSVENLNKYFNYGVGFNEYFDHIKYYSQFRNFGFNKKYNLLNILRKLGIKSKHQIDGSNLNAKVRRWFKLNTNNKILLWSHFFDLHRWPISIDKLNGKNIWAGKSEQVYNEHASKVDGFLETYFSILSNNLDMDETLIIISADHGEMLGEHDSYQHGLTLYDEEMNIPLIIYYPKYLDSLDVHDNISTIDIAPTVMDICGLDISDSFSGLSLKNILQGKKEKSRFCYMESSYTDKYAVKLNDYKFIYNGTNYIKMPRKIIRGNEMYNLKEDKSESLNIIDEKVKVAKKLENLLFKLLKVEDSLKPPSKLLLDETVDELIKLGYLKKEYNEK